MLADKTARLRRLNQIRIPDAARRVLRADRTLANRTDFEQIVSDICSELQRRSTAVKKKNRRRGISSPKIPEQRELKFEFLSEKNKPKRREEAENMALERRDHLIPDL